MKLKAGVGGAGACGESLGVKGHQTVVMHINVSSSKTKRLHANGGMLYLRGGMAVKCWMCDVPHIGNLEVVCSEGFNLEMHLEEIMCCCHCSAP